MTLTGPGIQDLVKRYDTALDGAEARTIASVNKTLRSSYDSLETSLLSKYGKYTSEALPDLLPDQRKLLLLRETGDLLNIMDAEGTAAIQDRYRSLIRYGDSQGLEVSKALTNGIGDSEILRSSASVPLDAIREAAENSVGRLARHTAAFADSASNIVGMGLSQGWGAQKTASALRSQLGITTSQAETIARTESMSAFNGAARRNYSKAGIEYGQWHATNDGKVCAYCLSRNQKVYRLVDIVLPAHPRDRCYITPWKQEWLEDGLVDTEFSEQLRADTIAQSELTPNGGLTPFERAAKLEKPPTPVWTPGE